MLLAFLNVVYILKDKCIHVTLKKTENVTGKQI